ncbi:2-keto-3-deoxygluconate permease [Alicyclobacillus acidoterrestris]|uniref:2-keto-3-deoxygluconate permease n=1 Tax=Alicyclobacillus suci TaxID=2816080 RepID=UPI001194D393|nr:2-keto-3-deoxygluconate permease [Alicyclobacillus suci]GEO24485.1 2-keto-3-deoxygluconate permease [Alicyclobacillus acidoterrestris]
MPIKRFIDKIPGGMMIVPLFIGAIIRTIDPNMFDNTVLQSSFTGGLLSGTSALLGAFYVCLGSTIEFKAAGIILKKGITLWLGKVLFAALVGLLIKLFAHDPNHLFLGLSALAIVAAFSDTNGGMYMALLGQLGTAEEVAACSIISLESGPFFTMLILGVVGLASFPFMSFVFVILPMLVGMILGNLDEEMRSFLSKGKDVLIPLFSLALGCGINLTQVVKAGGTGIVLGLGVVVLTGAVMFILDKLTKGNGIAGLAASSTAGNASAVPVAVAATYVGYKGIAATATVQVAASVIVTAILVPIITTGYARIIRKRTTTSENDVQHLAHVEG